MSGHVNGVLKVCSQLQGKVWWFNSRIWNSVVLFVWLSISSISLDVWCNQWLNNCLKKKNYTTFILLMVFVFLMVCIGSLNYLKQKPIAHSRINIDCLLLQQLTIEGGNSHCNIFQIFCGKERDGNQTQEKAACSVPLLQYLDALQTCLFLMKSNAIYLALWSL